ncbi:protease modulator HflK [Mesosutterella sp. AGMB02718]|uniref:Protease modulator HflK n=1 Tax=Mesosutterella faecium TaxID=2925194 RepID=A0ABT7ILK0_9BURK|nr:protease modulator HflK [Mesosutterella sp. AGMB02718]MDL2059240.1 protease modulator HflK [Mesosutterella sp. AGMB02718]
MPLDDNRWGRRLEPEDKDGAASPHENKRDETGEDSREPSPRSPSDSSGEGSRAPAPRGARDAGPGAEGSGSEDSRRSARDLEAEWQAFNELLRGLNTGRGRRPGEKRPQQRPSAPRGGAPGRGRTILPALIGLAVFFGLSAYLGAGFYTVPAGETAALYTTGSFRELVGPGTHWHLPWPFEKVRMVDTRLMRKSEVSFSGSGSEGYLLTADGALVRARGAVQWKVAPEGVRSYLEHVSNPSQAISSALRRAMRQSFGDMTVSDAMEGRAALLSADFAREVQAEADALGLGVKIESVTISDVRLPVKVESAADSAQKAEGADEGAFRAAQRWAGLAETLSTGTARRILESAESYQQRVTHVAQADSEFLDYLYSRPFPEADRQAALERAWNAAMAASLPNPGELSEAGAADIMAVIRSKKPDAQGPADAKEGPPAVTAAEVAAAKKAAASAAASAPARGAAAAAPSSPAGKAAAASSPAAEDRDTTEDRSAYLRNGGR